MVKKEDTNEKKKKTAEAKMKKVAEKKADKKTIDSIEIIKEPKLKKEKTSDRSVLIKELKAKAKKLAAEIEGGIETEEIKEEFEKKRELLVPLDDYVKTGIHLGTKVITPDMKKFVYRRRADSIGVLNTALIDEYIKKAIDLISNYSPEEIILVCKKEAGWDGALKFQELTGIKTFTKKYPAGMMTNKNLDDFYEPELVIACDAWIDRNAISEAVKTNKKKIILCDTNNFTKNADAVIPCNNKHQKSLALVFYLLAKGYVEKKKMKVKMPSLNSFIGDDGQSVRG